MLCHEGALSDLDRQGLAAEEKWDGTRVKINKKNGIVTLLNRYQIDYTRRLTEIVDAAKKIAEKVKDGELALEDVNENTFEKYLYTAHMPNQEPDLIIRTSGEERLSGFLLWQSAYSELAFLDVYWPDFRLIDLLRAIRTFQTRKRRYGK